MFSCQRRQTRWHENIAKRKIQDLTPGFRSVIDLLKGVGGFADWTGV
jgi:hypothetical protein